MSGGPQDLPSLHPSLALHLSDEADTPIISSAPPPPPPGGTNLPSSPSSSQPSVPRRTTSRSAAISSLNRSALASYSAAQRFGLGNPVRIMVECVSSYHHDDDAKQSQNGEGGGRSSSGPMVLNTYIPPLPRPTPQINGAEPQASEAASTGGLEADVGGAGGVEDGTRQPPLLVAVVVAPDGESQTVADARLAASRLARVGRRLQATWAEEEGG